MGKLRTLLWDHRQPQCRIQNNRITWLREERALEYLTVAIKQSSSKKMGIIPLKLIGQNQPHGPSQTKGARKCGPTTCPQQGRTRTAQVNSWRDGEQEIRIILGKITAVPMTFQSSEVNAVSTFRKSLHRTKEYIHNKCNSGSFQLEMVRNDVMMLLIYEINWHGA